MGAIDEIVQVVISQQTQAVQQQSFSIPAIFGPSDRFAAVSTTGTTVNGSAVLTALASTSGIAKGQLITGTGIPDYTYVLAVLGTTVTMSQNATASGSGVSLSFKDLIRSYSTLSGMVSDGFLTTDPEYVRATELLEQALQPELFYVGLYFDAVAQVDTFSVNTLNTSHLYTLKINGETVSYQATGGDAEEDVLNGLLADIATVFPGGVPATGSVVGTGPAALLTLTSASAGVGVTYSSIDADLTHLNTVANHTITSDIAAAQNMNDSWYGLTVCSQTASDILQVAAYVETLVKIFVADSADSDILTGSTTDVASQLKGKAYNRTALLYSGTPDDGAAAAWLGGQLPQTPGASTWKFKQLVGITPDVFTDSQRTACIGIPGVPGKNCNIYETVGGVGITEEGFMVSGRFIDQEVGVDWLSSTMQTNVYALLVNAPKIPYTDQGAGIVENAVRQTLLQGVANGLIDGTSPITVTVPKVLDVPANTRAERLLPDVNFSCRLAGAIHFVQINGVVTV